MVTGIDSFKEWFKGYEEQYAIIGGTACDILMTEGGLDFRATKDIDLVLIIEALDVNFGKKFWEYVKQAGYEHCNKSSGVPQFYRFSHPVSNQYPAMIELFTRKLDAIQLPEDTVITPLPIDEDISSLSAILLDDDYYEFLKQGKVIVNGVTVLDAAYLIPFKAKAWLDLTDRKTSGEHVDSKNIKKHKNDVFRLTELIDPTIKITAPQQVQTDIQEFVQRMQNENIDLKQLGLVGRTKDQILKEIKERIQNHEKKNATHGDVFYLLPTAINSYNYITAQVSRPVSEALIPEPLLTQSVRIEIITDFSNRHKISQILLSEGGYDIKLDEYYSNKK